MSHSIQGVSERPQVESLIVKLRGEIRAACGPRQVPPVREIYVCIRPRLLLILYRRRAPPDGCGFRAVGVPGTGRGQCPRMPCTPGAGSRPSPVRPTLPRSREGRKVRLQAGTGCRRDPGPGGAKKTRLGGSHTANTSPKNPPGPGHRPAAAPPGQPELAGPHLDAISAALIRRNKASGSKFAR